MKFCSVCKTGDKANGKSYCKLCYNKRYGGINTKFYASRNESKELNRKLVQRYKSICGCEKCGEKRYWVLDLHHIDPSNKKFDFGVGVSFKRKTLKDEIRKCIVLCKNCHHDFHHLEKTEKIKLETYVRNNKIQH